MPRARRRILNNYSCLNTGNAQGTFNQRAPNIYIKPVSLRIWHQIVLAHSYFLKSIYVIAIHSLYYYTPIPI